MGSARERDLDVVAGPVARRLPERGHLVGPWAAGRSRPPADAPASEPAADSQQRSASAKQHGHTLGHAVDAPLDDAVRDYDGAQLAVADLRFAIGYLHGPAEFAAALVQVCQPGRSRYCRTAAATAP